MAIGDPTETEYMARRSLGLLLTRPGTKKVDSFDVSFAPSFGDATDPLGRPRLRLVLHLLGCWLALRGLFEGVLPFYSDSWRRTAGSTRPSTSSFGEIDASHETTEDRHSKTDGDPKIDWQATISHLADGGQGAVLRRRTRKRDLEGHKYLAKVLEEARVHSRLLLERLEAHEQNLAPPLAGMLIDLRAHLNRIETMLGEPRLSSFRPTESDCNALRNLYRTELESTTGSLFEGYRQETDSLVGSGPRQFAIDELVQRLRRWREQYLSGRVWLADRADWTVKAGAPDRLYELWCFVEMLTAARRLGFREIVQSSFLHSGQASTADFSLGSDVYAYYDFGARAFRKIASSELFATVDPVLPAARVEWLILNRKDFRKSLVIDTKYYAKWDSGQALKVLGYMHNFGVRQGAVVFAGEIQALERVALPVVEGLYRRPCPPHGQATLWILQLKPEPDAEARNREVLETFLHQALNFGNGAEGALP